MRTVLKFALAVCVAAAPYGSLAAAQGPGSNPQGVTPALQTLKPFRPYITVAPDYKFCMPFRDAWIALYDSKERLEEEAIDLLKAYPTATEHDSNRFDIDGDGDLEILELFPNEIGWRYFGEDLFVFQNEDDWNVVMKPFQDGTGGQNERPDREPNATKPYRVLFSSGRDSSARRFIIDGHLYTMDHATLYRLDGEKEPQVVCEMNVDGYVDATSAFLQSSSAVVAARDIYGYTPSQYCNGTIGWTAPPLGTPLPAILHRPWTMEVPDRSVETVHSLRRQDALRELTFMSWGLKDPQSWRDYVEFHDSRPQFIADMRAYYVTHFAKSESEAQGMAEQAWRELQSKLMYGALDVASFGGAFAEWDDQLPFTADASPAQIVRALDDWYASAKTSQKTAAPYGRVAANEWMSGWLLVASIYTRQPLDLIRPLAEEWRTYANAAPDPTADPAAVERRKTNYQRQLDGMLLASLGHTGITNYVLELGANPAVRTSGFSKTPLMYAAQRDQLNAVQLLLSRGVDVNVATEVKRGEMCEELSRDHRTALMYAAENASEPLIDALLKAGADVIAKDTKGNAALWYFGRNAKITDLAVRARISKRLGG